MIFSIKRSLGVTVFLLLAAIIGAAQKPELVVQTGHSGSVWSVAFSPDGKTLATGSQDHTVKLWDVSTGAELRTLNVFCLQVAFSPDGKILAGGGENDIKLWDVSTGAELRTLKGHSSDVTSVTFSPDGKTLASSSYDKTVKLWDASTGAELRTLKGHSDLVNSVAFSPNGKTLASGSRDLTIKVWDVPSGAELRTLKGHNSTINAIAFSPDSRFLASASGEILKIVRGVGTASLDDNPIRLWDLSTGSELRTFIGHSRGVTSIAFSPDGKTLASGSGDSTVKLWDVSTGAEFRTLKGHSTYVKSVTFSPDGKTLASGSSDKTVKLWEVSTGTELRTLKGHSTYVVSVAFSPDGKTIARGSGDNTVKLWDISAGAGLRTFNAGSCSFGPKVAFSPDGKTLAGGCPPGVRLWDVSTGAELRTLKGHSAAEFSPNVVVHSVVFSPNGKILASGREDSTVKLWEVSTGTELRTLKGHSKGVWSVAFSPDGKTLASGSADSTVKLWDVSSGAELRALEGHSSYVESVAFSPDGKTLASGSADSTVKLWDVSSGAELRALEGHSSYVESVAFSPDGKTLAAGEKDVKLWDVSTGAELRTLKGHSSSVYSLAFTPDGKTLASGGGDGRLNLWDVGSGNNLASLISLDERDWVVVTPDGRFDGSPDGIKLISYVQDNKLLPLDSFFEQFYTPKLLQRVYAREALPATTAKVDFSKRIKLPPLVRIVSPKPGATSDSDSTQIVVEATDQGGGVEDIRLYQNGKLISDDTRQLTRDTSAKSKTFDVILLPGINTFGATAFNTDRTEATPDEIKIELKAAEASSNLYILAIGLNEYKNTRYNLNYGRADAQAFADAIEQRGRGIFKQINKRVVFDADATRINIEAAFNEIIKQARPQDAFVFYYAGHGVMSESDDKNPADFYLVPYEVVRIYGDDGSLRTNGIAARNLRELLKNVRAQKQLIILDACESGGAVETIAMRGASEEKAIMQLARSAGVAVLASAGQDQVATEFGKLGHGVFTYALLKGLSGEADGAPRDGKITIKELEAYINDQVPELTKLYRGKRQDPNSWTRGQDFPIAIR